LVTQPSPWRSGKSKLRLLDQCDIRRSEAAAPLGFRYEVPHATGRRQLKQMLDDCCLIQLDRRRGVTDYSVRDPQSNPCVRVPLQKSSRNQ